MVSDVRSCCAPHVRRFSRFNSYHPVSSGSKISISTFVTVCSRAFKRHTRHAPTSTVASAKRVGRVRSLGATRHALRCLRFVTRVGVEITAQTGPGDQKRAAGGCTAVPDRSFVHDASTHTFSLKTPPALIGP